jgi:hypothetical protein
MEQQRLWIAVAVAMAMMVFPFHCLVTDYTVGDSSGWILDVDEMKTHKPHSFTFQSVYYSVHRLPNSNSLIQLVVVSIALDIVTLG